MVCPHVMCSLCEEHCIPSEVNLRCWVRHGEWFEHVKLLCVLLTLLPRGGFHCRLDGAHVPEVLSFLPVTGVGKG